MFDQGKRLSEILTPEVGSTSLITTSSGSTIELLEQCLPFAKNRYLRCFSSEPWCYSTMDAAIVLPQDTSRKRVLANSQVFVCTKILESALQARRETTKLSSQ